MNSNLMLKSSYPTTIFRDPFTQKIQIPSSTSSPFHKKNPLDLLNIENLLLSSKSIQEKKNETTSREKIESDPQRDLIIQYSIIESSLSALQQEFQTTRKVKISSLLHEMFAEKLYQHILRMPDNQWYVACGIRNIKYEKKLLPMYQKKNQDNINEANKTFGKGEFSYTFHRAMNNVQNEISQFELILRNVLGSQEFMQLLSKITQLPITQLNTMFLSRYRSGQFLSPHSDKGNGKIAYVINLTKNWLPQYGGNLHFLSEDRKRIIETWTPEFNNMVIFYVPPEEEKDCGMPHFVGHVAPNVKNTRYAITGWYS